GLGCREVNMRLAPTLYSALISLAVACGAKPVHAPVAAPPAAAPATAAPPAAAPDPLDRPTATDPRIVVGKLANGLTYYVLKHQKPEKRAALCLPATAPSAPP